MSHTLSVLELSISRQIPTEERNGYLNILKKGENKMSKIKIAAIQMPTVTDKMENVKTVKNYLEKIKDEKPDFVILPEMFCCPYQTENFPVYAEEENGPVWQQLSAYAKQYGIYLIGGSMPEKDAEGNVYNT